MRSVDSFEKRIQKADQTFSRSVGHAQQSFYRRVRPKKKPQMLMGINVLNGAPVFLSEEDRAMHMHIPGTTGAGKSKLMEHMIRCDIDAGRGLILIDPHGDLYKSSLNYVVRRRLSDKTILIDPNDEEWAVGINYLEYDPDLRSATSHASEVMNGIAKVFGGEDTDVMPRLQRWERNALIPLIERTLTLTEVSRFVDPDSPYLRQLLLREVKNIEVLDEWERFAQVPRRDKESYVEAVFNRAHKFAASDNVRRMFGQIRSTVDLRKAMDKGMIVLCNLGCDKISQEEQRMLGVVVIDKLIQAGKSRMNIPRRLRRPFYAYLDEFGLYVSKDIARALQELRKFQVRFVLAHQELEQLREEDRAVYSAVMAEPQVRASFRVSREDAEILAKEMFTGWIEPYEKRRIEQTKFWPKETTRTIEMESESWAEGSFSGYAESAGEGDSSGTARGFGGMNQIPFPVFLEPDRVTISEVSVSSVMSSFSSGSSSMQGGSRGSATVPWYEYKPFKEVSSIQDYTVEEIAEKYIAWVKRQEDRHMQLQIKQRKPKPITTPFVKDLPVRSKDIQRFKEEVYSQYALPAHEVDKMLEERRTAFLEEAVQAGLIEPDDLPELDAASMKHK